jgi:hypothetical protein
MAVVNQRGHLAYIGRRRTHPDGIDQKEADARCELGVLKY